MADLPRWNLTNIYPAPDSKEFFDAIEFVKTGSTALLERIKNYDGSDFKSFLCSAIAEFEAVSDETETLGSYAYANFSTDTTDKNSAVAMGKVQEISVCLTNLNVLFTKFIADHKDEVRALTSDGGPLSDYRFVLEETISDSEHMMSPELEELAADLNRSGCSAFENLQESISSVASTDFKGEKKTVIELRYMCGNPDREVRKLAYEKEVAIWKEHEVAFAASLNGVKGTCLTLEKRRGWADPLERSVNTSRINMDVLNALIGAIEDNLPMFRRYFKAKAKALGLEQMAYYDIFAPVGEGAGKKWPYEEARDFIVRQYTAFNPEQGAFVKNAFDAHWIDPQPRSGKAGGAYDTYFPKVKESRVFANFSGEDYDGVGTLAHELGHAWHDHIVSEKPAFIRSYPMTLAETASIFGEFIVFKGAVAEADDSEKLYLIENFLQNASQVCVDILARFYFERDLFARRREGELMPDELCALMVDAQKRAYGDGISEETIHPYMWAVKGHYYSAGFSFYNYPYAFGQLFGLGLYKRGQEEGGSFCDKFNRILSLTGQYDAITVAREGGCDITSKEFWQEGLDIIASYVTEFEKLVG